MMRAPLLTCTISIALPSELIRMSISNTNKYTTKYTIKMFTRYIVRYRMSSMDNTKEK